MRSSKNAMRILLFGVTLLFIAPNFHSQTKQLKRPNSRVGVSSVDQFVQESFDIYDKVYKYYGYAETVKNTLDSKYNISGDRLETERKALNKWVEFI